MGQIQVTFRDIPPSPSVTHQIEKRAAKLETFFDRIIKCHVVVEAPHRHSRHGQRFHVRVDMVVPGKELVASHNLDDAKEDAHAAVDDAFNDAERVLEEYARVMRRSVKDSSKSPHGVVSKLFGDRGYGFIQCEDDGHEIYFHKNSVLHGKFEKLTVGTRVRYAEEDGDKGPQASTVDICGHS